MDFENILAGVRSGAPVKSSDVLPYLCLEKSEERCRANFRLAEAFAETNNFEQARVFITRAWILSRFSTDVLPLYIKIHSGLNDIDSIRGAYKRLGMVESSKGNVVGALKYFNQWQYAYASHQKLDKYQYDFDVLERIEQMSEPWRFREYSHSKPVGNIKIRLAYLMFGMTDLNSVIVKINCMFAKYHDKERFKVAFFVPDPKSSVNNSPQGRSNIKLLREYGCDVTTAPYSTNDLNRLLAVARQIYDFEPDVLITNVLLAYFEHYFIASLRPAPCVVGLLQGPPPQFAAPSLDWCISWSKHPLIDSPCDCSLVNLGLDLPDRSFVKPYSREDLELPQNSQVLMSAGRYVKFQERTYWEAILDILSRFPNLFYVAVGVSKEEVPFLDELVTNNMNNRIRLLGWREDCLNIMCLADVLIDTYPSGGGHVLIDAMSLGIPFVSFENNYLKEFDQTDWSVADEFVDIPELMVGRGDFDQFKNILSSLISDGIYREKMGKLCKEQIQLTMGNPDKGIRLIEDILVRVITENQSKKKYLSESKTPRFIKRMLNKLNIS
jgi:hypothetical protein